jgi:xanthine dehydrogenase YagS FAD-binding subunit
MKSFSYVSAPTEADAVKLLNEKSLALAGGTSILNLMKDYVIQPEVLVNLKSIPDLAKIEGDPAQGMKIGANVTLTDILDSGPIRKGYPALVQALWDAATPQIRNMSTLGGNLCARPPCWYYKSEAFHCRKKGGPNCPAEGGENEYLSILGHDGLKCHAVHGSSAAPALVVYGAKVRIAGAEGAREMPLEQFFVLPDDANVQRENVLKPNEFVTHVILPKASGRSATYEVRQKESHDWPLALCSVAFELDGAACRGVRICLGAVAPVPLRSKEAEAALEGQKPTEETAAAAGERAVASAKPMERNGYKVKITQTAVKRAILAAAGLPIPRRS